jgi:hypothetical protein
MAKRGLKFRRGAQVRGAPTARTVSVPAPVGGLNAVDSLAAMPATDAVIMDNWFPQPSFVSLRKGYTRWKTGLPGWVETLMGYSNLTTTERLFGISGTSVYDCTAAGAVGAAVVTGLTNARWEYTNVSVPGGAWLYAANGVDKPLAYDGTTWTKVDAASTPAITGITTTLLRNPTVWKSRIWFIENNTNKAWYLPVQSIGGAATSFDLSTIFRLGGSLQAIITFSVSSATSFDDYIGFVSTEGELAVYQGTDPSSASTFAITGVYHCGKPIGRRCWFKYGADAVLITANGILSVTKIISVGIQQPEDAVSYKILNLINTAVQAYSSNFGWEGVVYPLGNKLIINVPQNTNSRMNQFVMNTINESWCTYGYINTPWNAATFCVLGNKIYFGGNLFVAQCDTTQGDAGAQILGSVKPAFSYMGTDKQKQYTMVRPILQTTGTVGPVMALNVDFQDVLPTGTPTFSTTGAALWNVALWNVSFWSTGPIIQKNWQTIFGIGFSATTYLQVASTLSEVNLLSFDYLCRDGGVL